VNSVVDGRLVHPLAFYQDRFLIPPSPFGQEHPRTHPIVNVKIDYIF